jgi:hypothetical protein
VVFVTWVNHSYGDHVSLLKFFERNWRPQPLTDRSRDNLPNAKMRADQLAQGFQKLGPQALINKIKHSDVWVEPPK